MAATIESKPEVKIEEQSVEDVLSSYFGGKSIDDLIEAAADRLIAERDAAKSAEVQERIDGPKPKPALAVFRHDRYPNAQIQRLDMSQDDPSKHPMKGQYIVFRLGQFRVEKENDLKQLRWMASQSAFLNGGADAGPGFPGLYEDTGEIIYSCPHCANDRPFATANKARYDAHLLSMH